MDQEQINTFINQYVSMWHEPDPARRREILGALFAEDAENYTRAFAARGRDEIIFRKWCKTCGGHLFTGHPHMGVTDVYAAIIPELRFKPALNVHYQESVLHVKDGLQK